MTPAPTRQSVERQRQAGVDPALRAPGQVVQIPQATRLGDPCRRLTPDTGRADENDPISRQRVLGIGPQPLQRNQACAREMAGRPFSGLADIDDVESAVGDQLVSLLRRK